MSKTKEIQSPKWEMKSRTYYLSEGKTPLTYTLSSKNSARSQLMWFDESTGTQREIRYATNQASPFVDEQKGEVTMGHIIFENGSLTVPKQKQNLQKLLSLYHPRLNSTYHEYEAEVEAEDDMQSINLEIDALIAAREMEIDLAEAILRVEKGTAVSTMSSKEVKRDLLIMAKNNPNLFLSLAADENVELRNIGIIAVEQSILKLSQDQRDFLWGSNNRKLMTIPFDENPYSALAAWFKTDEGVEVFKTIKKKLQ